MTGLRGGKNPKRDTVVESHSCAQNAQEWGTLGTWISGSKRCGASIRRTAEGGCSYARPDGRMRPSLRERLLVQRAAAIRRWNMRFQKVSYALVRVNLVFYF